MTIEDARPPWERRRAEVWVAPCGRWAWRRADLKGACYRKAYLCDAASVRLDPETGLAVKASIQG